jgi:hypothetical protein
MSESFADCTRRYEAWLACHIPLDGEALAEKHRLLREDPFPFLRGTFYRWLERIPEVVPDLGTGVRVLAVGDLHVENFGTWRDAEGRLVWGVNDLDEVAELPYLLDLVRLGTSAVLAAGADRLALGHRDICTAILDGYADGLERPAPEPCVLAERHQDLRDAATAALKPPKRFWKELGDEALAAEPLPAAATAALSPLLPAPDWGFDLRTRAAGLGSRGHRRFVALGHWAGGMVAREVKELGPPTAAWVHRGPAPAPEARLEAMRHADPLRGVGGGWSVRRLSPDCVKLDLAEEHSPEADLALLHAMGEQAAGFHRGGGASAAALGRDLETRGRRAFSDAVVAMADDVRADWRAAQHEGHTPHHHS